MSRVTSICAFDTPIIDETGRLLLPAAQPGAPTLEELKKRFVPGSRRNRAQRALSSFLFETAYVAHQLTEMETYQVIPAPRTEKERRALEAGYILTKPKPGMRRMSPTSEFWQRPHPLRKQRAAYYEAAAKKDACRFLIEKARLCKEGSVPAWVTACAEVRLPRLPWTRTEARRLREYEEQKRPRQRALL